MTEPATETLPFPRLQLVTIPKYPVRLSWALRVHSSPNLRSSLLLKRSKIRQQNQENPCDLTHHEKSGIHLENHHSPTFLWLDLLIVHEALPGHRAGVKTEITLDILETRGGGLITPYLAFHLLTGVAVLQIPVRGFTFPLAKRRLVGNLSQSHGLGQRGAGQIVCCLGDV